MRQAVIHNDHKLTAPLQYEKILEVFAHPDYTSIVVPDELKFMNRMKSSLVAGQCAMILGA